jgi:hypothetical protein
LTPFAGEIRVKKCRIKIAFLDPGEKEKNDKRVLRVHKLKKMKEIWKRASRTSFIYDLIVRRSGAVVNEQLAKNRADV